MNSFVRLSNQEKWEAVKESKKAYDGKFFYGVKTTGIFCRPSCRAKTPLRDNVLFFNTSKEALKAGFRPCKRCQPDQIIFQLELDLIKKAIDILNKEYTNEIRLEAISRQLGVSGNHLGKLFKMNTGKTIIQVVKEIRVEKSLEILMQHNKNILEVAYMTGFKSLSNFYKCFKELKGCTPKEYQRSNRKF
ncbi:bifunctional transcriptional activator/DNA repair enzyme AdaA [Alkaliphilus transvaalensis]|uniref:bifunctional transcriptional activator/DNA repair enzyme AdaA n=1 Tax=Alkaliphilus transvaalensis TaxID=114628 RepID=UPI00047BFF80|nr:Ada metal-binding domain-containing protein [Alkaliphilus transvaalensis]